MPNPAQKQGDFVESRLSNVELGGVNGVKRGKSHQNLTAAQAAISNDAIGIWVLVGKSIEEWLKIKVF